LNNKTKTVEYISVDRQIDQPPLDTNYVSIKEFVKRTGSFPTNKITPLKLAEMLERDCQKALQLVSGIAVKGNNTLMYEDCRY
jgi:hypothetical protein